MMWMRATVTAVGTRQHYAQYLLNEGRVPVEGAYHVRLLAHAEGGDGMARCYVRQPDFSYLPCYSVNIPDGQTIVVERAIGVLAGCGELIVRICPAAVVGATAMMSRISIEAADTYEIASGGGGFRASSPRRTRPISPQFGGGRVRIRNLYDPPTMDDRAPVTPWAPSGMTASSKTTDEGCEITATGKGSCWLYPPEPWPDGLANVVWQKKDGSYLVGINNMTVPIYEGVMVLTRLCGFNDRSLVPLLQGAGLPLVFAAVDHPY